MAKPKTPKGARRTVRMSAIIRRIETAGRVVEMPLEAWAQIALIILPEHFRQPTKHGRPAQSTPGSAARIRSMAYRLSVGLSLYHPDDPPPQPGEPGNRAQPRALAAIFAQAEKDD